MEGVMRKYKDLFPDVPRWCKGVVRKIIEGEEVVKKMFDRWSKANLKVNRGKSEVGHAKVAYLGYVVCQRKLDCVQVKVSVGNSTKALRKFGENFTDIVILRKNKRCMWNNLCQEAFECLNIISW